MTFSITRSSGWQWRPGRGASIAIDGPYGAIKDVEGYQESCRQARALGMVGKWALHPTQIDHAQDIFTPNGRVVEDARKLTRAYQESAAKGQGAVMIDGKFADAATVRLMANTLDLADLYGL